jgi:Right handed beta helix region
VRQDVKLSISGGSVQDGILESEGEGQPVGGLICIEGARLENTHVKFAAAGENCFENNWVYGTPGKQLVVASDEAELKIANNHIFTGTLTIADDADVSVVGNELHNVVVGMNLEDSQPGVQDIRIAGNRFYNGSVHHAGGNVTIHDNFFIGTRRPRPLHAIQVEDSPWQKRPGVAWILGNDFSGYERAVSLVEGATAFVADNVIRDNVDGMWVRYDAQATVQANTFMDNVHGFYLYDAPDLAVSDNCVAGNSYGVWRGNYDPGLNVAARRNWWGHTSGPEHESNPPGQGDIVSSGVDFADWLQRDNCFVEVASKVIGQAGGTAGSGSASASVSLPAGAVDANTRVAVKRMDPSSMSTMPSTPAGLTAMRLFDISARREDDGSSVPQLAKAATVTVNYGEQEAARVDEATLGLYFLGQTSASRRAEPLGGEGAAWSILSPGDATGAGAGEAWILLPGTLDVEGNTLTGRTSNLGTFAVLGEATASELYLPLVVHKSR